MDILHGIFTNDILVCGFWGWFIAQLIKTIVEFIKAKKIDIKLMYSSGGMPSSHSSLVMACTTAIAYKNGVQSDIFGLSLIVSMVIMYDAAGVRRAAGRQAKVLNDLLMILDTNIKLEKKLKELLGHTPFQVFCGAMLGILVSVVYFN